MDPDRRREAQEIIEEVLARLSAQDPTTADLSDALRGVEQLRSRFVHNGNGHNGHDPETQELEATGELSIDPQIVLEPADAGESVDVSVPLLERLARKGLSPLHYHSLAELARGGMGSVLKVWDSELRRPIAMKVAIGRGKDGSPADLSSLARFLEEAQITGQLNHPGIVPVHELGVDGQGRVYFTMRLVRGRNLREIFDLVRAGEEGWTSTRALGVLMKVCEAMAYAHSRGVIHRDLKPSNIMVGRYGEVYVMDWGVAKVLGRPDSRDLRIRSPVESASIVQTERSANEHVDPEEKLITMDGAVVGTASYMSPEQARGEIERMDQRSDVYSLGAILYQLLTGQIPYVAPDARGVSAHLVLMWLLERAPRPVHEINPTIPAELVAICDKAMAREPGERYADPLEMAADLSAYIDGRVVRAYRTGALVELRKWVSRNKPMAASLAAAFLLLFAGWIATTALFRRAEHNARVAEEVADFLNDDLLGAVAPPSEPGRGENLSLEALIDEASKRLDGRFDDMPEAESRIRLRVGRSYLSLGRYQLAEPHLVRAVDLYAELFGPRDPRTLEALGSLAELRHSKGDYREAERLHEACLSAWRRTAGRESREALRSLNDLANVYLSQGRHDEAELQLTECYEVRQRLWGDDDEDTLAAASDLADVFLAQGRYEEAEDLHTHCLEVRKRELGPDHTATLASIASVADVYAFRGRYDDAERLYDDCLAQRRRVSGEDHPDTLLSKSSVAFMHILRGRYDLAATVERECLEARRTVLGEDHPDTLASVDQLARIYVYQGRYGQAENLAEDCLERRSASLGDDHPDTLESLETLGLVYWVQARHAEADQVLARSLEARRRVLGKKHPRTLGSLDLLAVVTRSEGRLELARELQSECLDMRRVTLGDSHLDTLRSLSNLGVTLVLLGRLDDAQLFLERCLESRRTVLGAEHPDTLSSMDQLAGLRRVQGRFADAEELLEECLEVRELVLGEDHPDILNTLDSLAMVYLDQGRFAEAEELFAQCFQGHRRRFGDEHSAVLLALGNLAAVLGAQGHFTEAETRLTACVATCERVLDESHPTTLQCMDLLAGVYRKQERYAKAEELQARCVEIRRRSQGESHPKTIASINSLGEILAAQQRIAEAERLLLGSLEVQRDGENRKHPANLDTMTRLAQLYVDDSRFGEAVGLLEECLGERSEQLGVAHTITLDLVFRLGEAYRSLERFDDAQQLLTARLEDLRAAAAEESTGELLVLISLFRVHRQQREHALAVARGEEAYELAGRVFGPEHAATSARLDALMATYPDALDGPLLAEHAPERARYLEQLGRVYLLKQRFPQAREALEQSLELTRELVGSEHEDFYRRLGGLARVLAAQGLDEAEPLWIEALSGLRARFGDAAEPTLHVIEDLTTFYASRGLLHEARPLALELRLNTSESDPARERRLALAESILAP